MDRDRLILGELSLITIPHAQRCDAAARAGFTDVSLFWATIARRRAEGVRDSLFRAEADAAGVRIVQLEFASPVPRAGLAAYRDTVRDMAECAAMLGCEAIHAVALDRTLEFAEIVDCMALLAEAAAPCGLRCGLEFVPFLSAVEDLPSALVVIRAVGRADVGIVLDALHFQRGGPSWGALEGMAAHEIVTVQVNDGPQIMPGSDYMVEAMGGRLLPGAGEIDLRRLLATLEKIGCGEPLTVEVPNTILNRIAPQDAARQMADAARDLLKGVPAAAG